MKLYNCYLWLIGKQKVWLITLKNGIEKTAYTTDQFQDITKKGYSHYIKSTAWKTKTPKPKRKFKLKQLFKKRRNKIWEN